jgi:VCBS repeat-containing protein
LVDYTEESGRADVADVSHTNLSVYTTNNQAPFVARFNYSPNVVEFFDDSVAVNSSDNGFGSVNGNDILFSSVASFQRSTGSYNVRVAAGETIVGEYITLTMDADGDYTYTVNQGAFDALGDGETASESFTYWGASNPNAGDAIGQATLTFNLTGLADAFVAVDDTARVVTGATISGSSGDLGNQSSVSVYESSGTLISNDINDVGDLTVVGVWLGQETINATPTTIPPGGNVQVNGTYGVLTIYANGGYDYVANSGVTSEETEYFTYTVRNGDGEDDTAELAITILPAADNEFVVEDLSHTMNDIADEAGLTKTVTIANLLTHDANAIRSGNEDGASYAITGYAAGDSGSGFSNVGDTIRGTYGTLTISAAGVPTYVFDRPYSLKASERGYDVFTFEVTDGRGSPTTNTAQLTVQINGRNTTPSWSDDAAITITEDTGVTLTKYDDLAAQGSNNATGYNTALTGGWVNYLEDEFGDVDGYQFSKFDNASVDRSSYSTTEGWTSWRMTSGNFPDGKIGASTNQNTILIGSVPFGNNNTDDRITVDNTIQVGQSDVFNVSGELTGNINIRGTFDVTVIGVQNTPVVDLDDDSATEPTIFRFGNFYQGGGGGTYPTNTVDLFSNDTTSDYSNILRIEISADGASGWTAISQDSDGNAAPAAGASILSGSDFYWRGDKYYAGESYIEFSPSNFEALPAGDDVTGSFYYRIVEVDGTTSSAAQVSATLTPTDDPPEVHRQGAVLDGSGSGIDSSGSISVGASDQPNWNNNDGRGLAKPPSGVSNFYEMGNNGDDGDGVSIEEVDMPGEHTGGLLDQSNSTSSADPEDNSVILSVTPRYVDGATTYELSGLGNNSSTSVTLRGNHGELTVNEDGSYSYTADFKAALNWSYSSGYEYYDYVDSFDIELGPTGVGGAGSVTTTLDIFFDGTDGAPVASDDTAHVREDAAAINVSGNAAASTAGGDDDNAVDAPGEHSGNLLANDTDVNPNANLRIVAAGNGNTLWAMSLGTVDNPYAQIAGTYGTLSIYQDGSYTYAANDDAADVLGAGETSNDVFRYRVSDNNNDYGNADLTITVHGTANETYDRDVDTDENTPYSFVHTIENNVITATDFYASDADYSAYNPPIIITSLPHAGTLKLSGVDVVLTNGTKTISGDDLGDLSYVPPDDTHGDDFTFFNYQILDVPNMGGVTVTMTIDITPDPNNAAPTITDPTAVVASIAEIADGTTGETTADIEASGSFTIADGDSDSVSVSVTSSSTTNSGGSVLGTLTPTVSNNTDDGAGVVTWSYAINDSDLDTMAVGDSFTKPSP